MGTKGGPDLDHSLDPFAIIRSCARVFGGGSVQQIFQRSKKHHSTPVEVDFKMEHDCGLQSQPQHSPAISLAIPFTAKTFLHLHIKLNDDKDRAFHLNMHFVETAC